MVVEQHGHAGAAKDKDKDKKKNFSFTRRFPFMKSKDHSGSEDVSADERKLNACSLWTECMTRVEHVVVVQEFFAAFFISSMNPTKLTFCEDSITDSI